MCPGTLFMVKFVNWLEGNYPFADNIKPVSALWRILARENTLGLASIGWSSPASPHATRRDDGRQGRRHQPARATGGDDARRRRRRRHAPWLVSHLPWTAAPADEQVDAALGGDPERLEALMIAVMGSEPAGAWESALAKARVARTLGEGQGTLQLAESQKMDDKLLFREVAKAELTRAASPAEVVVLGHTHCPDDWRWSELPGKRYFQPGLLDALRRDQQAGQAEPGRAEGRSGFSVRPQLRAHHRRPRPAWMRRCRPTPAAKAGCRPAGAAYSPASARRAAALSVVSQVKSTSSRPKWP